MPFARELLLRDTKVILCANSEPALNDITYNELKDVIQHCCSICEIIKKAYDTEKLLIYGNGQSGPCLDFRNMSSGNVFNCNISSNISQKLYASRTM